MKKFIILVLIGFITSCHQKNSKPDFYKDLYTGEIYDEMAFREFQDELHAKYFDSTRRFKINYVLYEKVLASDSLIQPFKYDVRVGNTHVINSSQTRLFGYLNKEFPYKKLLTMKGDSIHITDVQNKPALINFWFTNCTPCVAEMPVLNKIKEKYADRMNFIAVIFEKEEDVISFLKKQEFNFEHVAEAEKLIDKIELNGYPKNLFIDKNGILKYIEGGIPYNEKGKVSDGQEFESIIEELL